MSDIQRILSRILLFLSYGNLQNYTGDIMIIFIEQIMSTFKARLRLCLLGQVKGYIWE